jgi:hypothetical protein
LAYQQHIAAQGVPGVAPIAPLPPPVVPHIAPVPVEPPLPADAGDRPAPLP